MFQRFNPLAWPRASWKQRLLAAVFAAVFVGEFVAQWAHRHDDLLLARGIAWFFIVSGFWFGAQFLVVVVLGRVPRACALLFHRPQYLKMTFSQIHRDIARERQSTRDRTRSL